ncbi:MAG: 5'/3'-nucleotidase SurE [bacterium]
MRILVSNDDGYLSPGLEVLAESLKPWGDVTVVAPDRDRSGVSHALTLDRPLRVTQAENGFYRVNGTPSDCVHLALTGLLDEEPKMVVSGINHGANLGDDVLYSGTVAAAMEGRFMGYPALALSINSFAPEHLASVAEVVDILLQRLEREPLPLDSILNVNVPDLPWNQIKGFKVTRLGQRHKSEPVVQTEDPRGRPIYWVGPAGPEQDAGEGTDFHAVREGYVSITPLLADLTRHDRLDGVQAWLDPNAGSDCG